MPTTSYADTRSTSNTRSTSRLWGRLRADEAGATAVEYGVIVSGIFLAIIGAVTLFSTNATIMWNSIAAHM